MSGSVTEVDSLEVSDFLDVPRILKLAIVVGLGPQPDPEKSLSQTAHYLKEIGLEKRVLPTSAISYIEQRAFAKLRKNPRIREMYETIFGLKPVTRHRANQRPRSHVGTDNPSHMSGKWVSEMEARRSQAKARKVAL